MASCRPRQEDVQSPVLHGMPDLNAYRMDVKKTLGKWTSGQDGGMGRYTVPLHIPKISTTTNLKTKNNQNCQKMELYGSPTTKELKKKHSSRPVGGAEMGSRGREDLQQGNGWQTGQSHISVWINWEEQLRSDRPQNPGSQCGEMKSQNF